jgi:hypothetical protein
MTGLSLLLLLGSRASLEILFRLFATTAAGLQVCAEQPKAAKHR